MLSLLPGPRRSSASSVSSAQLCQLRRDSPRQLRRDSPRLRHAQHHGELDDDDWEEVDPAHVDPAHVVEEGEPEIPEGMWAGMDDDE